MKKLFISLPLMAFLTGCNDSSVQDRIYENVAAQVSAYVSEFNSNDEEIYVQEYDNSEVEQFLMDNIIWG